MNNIQIGKYNTLNVIKAVDFGLYLDGGDPDDGGWGNILLPSRYVPANANVGDNLKVFIYFDSEDRIIATCEKPKAIVGEFAYLRVADVNAAGAFLDWGLPKDLLVPYAEQSRKMRQGAYYVVRLYQDDESQRITGSTRLGQFLDQTPPPYQRGDKHRGLVMAKTDLGYKVIIEHQHTGMLYHNEVFCSLTIGQSLEVIIAHIRQDNKIDLRLQTPDKSDLSELEQAIMDKLHANQGLLHISDKTPPQTIYQTFSVSKKHFKRAISRLYKQRQIVITPDSIHLPHV